MVPQATQHGDTSTGSGGGEILTHRVLLNLKGGAEWTLWPPTEKYLGMALCWTMLLLVLTEWSVVLPSSHEEPVMESNVDGLLVATGATLTVAVSWWQRSWSIAHMMPRAAAIALASYLPVSSHVFVLLAVLPFTDTAGSSTDHAWPMLGRAHITG
eukprot:CAMPEP_0119512962 /NCGR_PEP_ID=MMETSP1344-20130328/31194_1 /TAXON_ID=236787 /ORGANISM="Florenciella parvula, Strain CCMP2471" /LENGTH=155 /DNA_ID=CAMNT_0007550135 /DNA_START=39 /DNA_END=502 /DNA_ORIENTATION=-